MSQCSVWGEVMPAANLYVRDYIPIIAKDSFSENTNVT